MSTIRNYKVPGSFQFINLFLESSSKEELKLIFQHQEKFPSFPQKFQFSFHTVICQRYVSYILSKKRPGKLIVNTQ
jgi:hypothetical protein